MEYKGVKNMYKSHGNGKFQRKDFRKIGDNVIFEDGILIFNPENIEIGSNVYVGHNTILKAYHKNKMIIGNNTWIGQNCFFHSAGGIVIGDAVGIAPNVKILTSVHNEGNVFRKPIIFCELEFGEVIIGNGCDIGIGAIILPDVSIGESSIIGAGSVVTKNVPSYSVGFGIPFKVTRKRNVC